MRSIFCPMKLFRAGAMLLVTMALVSCSIDYSSVVEDWEEDGWRVVEEYGEIGEYSHYAELKRDRAKAVEASWTVNGERKTKLFSQNAKLYLVLRFEKPDGDIFAVVMSKGK